MKSKNIDKFTFPGKINGKRLNLDRRQSISQLPSIIPKIINNKSFIQKLLSQEKNVSKTFSNNKKRASLIPMLMGTRTQSLQKTKTLHNIERMRRASETINNNIDFKAETSFCQIKLKRHKSDKENVNTQQTTFNSKQSKYQRRNSSYSNIFQQMPFEATYFDKILQLDQGLISQSKDKEQKSSENIKCENTKKSIPLIKKTYQSIGVSTDLEIHNESYKEFLKFKITQKQKFSKLQQIFQFIEDISVKQFPILNQRYKKVKKLYEESQETERQKRTIQLKKQIKEFQSQFQKKFQIFSQSIISFQNKVLQRNFSQINRIKDFIIKISKQNNSSNLQINETKKQKCASKVKNFSSFISQLQKKNKQNYTKIRENNLTEKTNIGNRYQRQNVNLILQQIKKVLDNLEYVKYRMKQQVEEQIVAKINQLQSCFKRWSSAQSQKGYIIKMCVQDIVKLPQMSLSIFGMSKSEDNTLQMTELQKIGIVLDQIPQFDKFCGSKCSKQQINQAFQSMINVKCLNCAYLKNKMKFIYSKNSQIQPALKVINQLAEIQKHNYY